MCNPAAIAIGATAVSGYAQAQTATQQAEADAEAAAFSRDVERLRARDAEVRGGQESTLARLAGSQATAGAKASIAGDGVDVQTGSSLDAVATVRGLSEVDVATARANAAREAWGHRVQAQQFERARQNALEAGEAARWGSFLGVLGQSASLLGSRAGSAKRGA